MRQTRVGVFVHLVWATWDRLPLLVGERQRLVYRAIETKCAEMGAEIIALGGVEDHVHLLLRMPPTHSIADLVGQIKGASSHLATHVADATDTNRDFFKWQGAYGAFSVSAPGLPTVAAYINHQRQHHADGTTVAAYEPGEPVATTHAGGPAGTPAAGVGRDVVGRDVIGRVKRPAGKVKRPVKKRPAGKPAPG